MSFRRIVRSRIGAFASSCVLMTALFPGRPAAQAPKPFAPSANPVTDAVRNVLTRHARNLIASAELMPAENYGYQPTPRQMTFGQGKWHVHGGAWSLDSRWIVYTRDFDRGNLNVIDNYR